MSRTRIIVLDFRHLTKKSGLRLSIIRDHASYREFSDAVPDHVLEHIVTRLPCPSIGATRCVSQRWRALTTSPTFLALRRKIQAQSESWLYVNGFRYQITDPTLPSSPETPTFSHSWGAGGLMYVLRDTQSVRYKLSVWDSQWRETVPLGHSRALTIMGVISDGLSHKVVCAGGSRALSKVELFDSDSNAWEECEDMPEEFQGVSSRSVAAVVCGQKLYLYHIYASVVTSFDVVTKRWSAVKALRQPGVHYCYLAARGGSFYWWE